MDKSKRKLRGFTLLELIVVIAIIGVLAAILVPNVMAQIRMNQILTANDRAQQVYMAAQDYLISEQIKGTDSSKLVPKGSTNNLCWIVVSTEAGTDSSQSDKSNKTNVVDYYNISDGTVDDGTGNKPNYIKKEVSSGVYSYPIADAIESRLESGTQGSWMVAFYPNTFTVAYACFNDHYVNAADQAAAVKFIGTNDGKKDDTNCSKRLYEEIFAAASSTKLGQERDFMHPDSSETAHMYTGQFPVPGPN